MEFAALGLSDHSGLMFANLITLPHFSVSAAMNLPKSAGELTNGVAPMSESRAFILESARPALISLLSLSMISAGVFFEDARLSSPMPASLASKALSRSGRILPTVPAARLTGLK
jgi:hypothetical protein